MAVIGIDLGTTYCAVAQALGENQTEILLIDGNPTMPSVVGIKPNGKIAVGLAAKNNQGRNPQDTVLEVKRRMGKQEAVALGQKEFPPPEISAMMLSKIMEAAEEEMTEPVTGVVISCPAYFKDPQRQAIKQAAEIAKINLLNIINEPTAAAYAYGVSIDPGEDENLFLVYDLGGGTFDVTVIKMAGNSLEVIGTGGDPELGGSNFDDQIVNWILELLRQVPGYGGTITEERERALRVRLKAEAEKAKIGLCGPPPQEAFQFQLTKVDSYDNKPVVFNETLTMAKFEELIGSLLDNSMQWIDKAFEVPKKKHNYTEDDITAVLLVGGSTRVPRIRKMLQEKFPNIDLKGVEAGINPDEVVARGAAIYAAQVDPESLEMVRTMLVDVTGHTLSVAAMDSQVGRELLQPLIPKETAIPTRASHQFGSAGNFQPRCNIRVYQGESEDPKSSEVTMIGEFLIDIEQRQESIPLMVGLELDKNAILTASCTDMHKGQHVSCTINYNDSAQISPEELKAKQAQFEAQMSAVVGATHNPLDGAAQPQAPAGGFAQQPMPPAGMPPAGMPPAGVPPAGMPPAGPAASPPMDATAMMNPIMRAAYNKAINSFGSVPADRHADLATLVAQIEQVALSGDTAKLMTLYGPLNQLLEGVD